MRQLSSLLYSSGARFGRAPASQGPLTAEIIKAQLTGGAWLSVIPSGVVDQPQLSGLVNPGGPIPFSWGFWTVQRRADLESVTATIYLDSDAVYTSPPVKLNINGQSADTDSDASGPQAGVIQATDATFKTNQPLLSRLYTVGSKQLRLAVTGNNGQGPFTDEEWLFVVPEDVRAWWSWTSPLNERAAPARSPVASIQLWKQPYTVTGQLTNRSQVPMMQVQSFTATLSEHDTEAGTKTDDVGKFTPQPALLPRESTGDLAFPPITQSWEWLVPFFWLIDGSLLRGFRYSLSYSFNDAYGNVYTQDQSPFNDLMVEVSVSDTKYALAIAAQQFFLLWVGASAVTFGGGGLIAGAVASAAAATMGALGKAALDPPEPDPRFREDVHVEFPTYAVPSTASDPASAALIPIVEAGQRIALALDGLSTIEGRILGALQAKDRAAVQRQVAAYQALEERLQAEAVRLAEAAPAAQAAVESGAAYQPDRLAPVVLAWQRSGLPKAVTDRLKSEGLTDEALRGISAAVKAPQTAEAVRRLSAAVLAIAQELGFVALRVRSDYRTSRLLRGL